MPTPRLPAFVLDETKAPPMNDKRWDGWSQPVLAFLGEPRSWAQLLLWMKEQRMNEFRLRHCLAYLEEKGLARTHGHAKGLRWVASDYRGSALPTEPQEPSLDDEEGESDADTSPQSEQPSSDLTEHSQTGT